MEWLQAHLPQGVISVISFFSMFGEELLLVMIFGFLYWSWNKKTGRSVAMCLLLTQVWNPMIKNVFLRRRPYMDHEGIQILRVVEPSADPMNISAQGYSFPSGHSSASLSTFGMLAAKLRKRWMTVVAVALPLLVGFSRVTVGAHYPTDVLGGWALALIGMCVVTLLEKHVPDCKKRYAVILLLTLPGLFYCKSADYFSGLGLLVGFMAGTLFEEKYVQFENTRDPVRAILRVIVGGGIFLGLNSLLKLPFSKEFLSGGSYGALLIRLARYTLATFVMTGVYPIAFKYTANIGKARK